MRKIIDQLNEQNGSNHKIAVLTEHKDNDALQKLLKMTYCKVGYTYGITLKNIPEYTSSEDKGLVWALEQLESLADRTFTGNAAIAHLTNILSCLSAENADIIEKVIKRDLRINMGRSSINKVFKDLVVKPPYMRCGIYSTDKMVAGKLKKGTAGKIKFPAYLQLKADGTYRSITVEQGVVTINSRSGEEYVNLPKLAEAFSDMPDGIYVGELLVRGITNRSKGNGLINSSNPPEDKIFIQLWDFIELTEWADGKHKNKKLARKTYKVRFAELQDILTNFDSDKYEVIPSTVVNNLQEAVALTMQFMKDGYEGAILKDFDGIFKDHTSPLQLKMKVCFDIDVRITGFIEGTPGTKRELTFGSFLYSTDDGMLSGSASGISDELLADFNNRREELVGMVMEVKANDITQGEGSNTWALSHPRFTELRNDKDTTDTIERAFESLESGKEFKGI